MYEQLLSNDKKIAEGNVSDRILIVEDSRLLAESMQKYIEKKLGETTDIAHSLEEAKMYFSTFNYSIALCDLNLPDAPNGEIIDYAMEVGVPAMVITENINHDLRKHMVQKNIIDFIPKNSPDHSRYALRRIKQLLLNKKRKVLVVDDSRFHRRLMCHLLKIQMYHVLEAGDGAEALDVLQQHPDVKVVVTDYKMPRMNGIELTIQIRKKFPPEKMSIIAVTQASQPEILAEFLKMGANDFMQKPYLKDAFDLRVNNTIIALDNIDRVFNLANKDYLTGLCNRRFFFEKAEEYLSARSREPFAVVMLDIDHFKNINDAYGHEVGDIALKACAKEISANIHGADLLSRFGGEEFCLLLKDISGDNAYTVTEKIRKAVEHKRIATPLSEAISLTVSAGICADNSLSLTEMIRQADGMLYEAKQDGRNRTRITDPIGRVTLPAAMPDFALPFSEESLSTETEPLDVH